MIHEKNKVPKTPGLTPVSKILGLYQLFFPILFKFAKKKKKKKKKSKKEKE